MEYDRFEIDINGKRFELSKQIIDRIVHSDCEASGVFIDNTKTEKISLERNAQLFVSILSFYQGRSLHIPPGCCPAEFEVELIFWGIDRKHVSKCCMRRLNAFSDEQQVLNTLERNHNHNENARNILKELTTGKCSLKCLQARGWLILDEPTSSLIAKVSTICYRLMMLYFHITHTAFK